MRKFWTEKNKVRTKKQSTHNTLIRVRLYFEIHIILQIHPLDHPQQAAPESHTCRCHYRNGLSPTNRMTTRKKKCGLAGNATRVERLGHDPQPSRGHARTGIIFLRRTLLHPTNTTPTTDNPLPCRTRSTRPTARACSPPGAACSSVGRSCASPPWGPRRTCRRNC